MTGSYFYPRVRLMTYRSALIYEVMIMEKITARKKPLKIYRPPREADTSAEAPLRYWVECPKCGGRAMDISDLPERRITLGCKCPCCKSFVDLHLVSFTDASRLHYRTKISLDN